MKNLSKEIEKILNGVLDEYGPNAEPAIDKILTLFSKVIDDVIDLKEKPEIDETKDKDGNVIDAALIDRNVGYNEAIKEIKQTKKRWGLKNIDKVI